MPSEHCRQNPFSYRCIENPDYSPTGVTIFNPTGIIPSIFNQPITSVLDTPSSGPRPKIITNAAGVSVSSGQTTLDKILGTFLSAFALHKGAGYVPTTAAPAANDYGAATNTLSETELLAYMAAREGQGSSGNIFGDLGNIVKNNPGAVLIGGIVFAAFLMKPPTRR